MLNQKLRSELLFEQMMGAFSKEECVRTAKDIRLKEIRSYICYFEGYLHEKKNHISEELLDDIATSLKFFFRIEDRMEGIHIGNNANWREDVYKNNNNII